MATDVQTWKKQSLIIVFWLLYCTSMLWKKKLCKNGSGFHYFLFNALTVSMYDAQKIHLCRKKVSQHNIVFNILLLLYNKTDDDV